MKESISKLLKQRLYSAAKGKRLFIRFFRKYKKQIKKVFVIFPDHDKKINHYGLLYLDDFLLRNEYKCAVIITSEQNLCDTAKTFSEKIVETVFIPKTKMQNLIDYYAFNPTLQNILIISLEKPQGRNGTSMIGKKDLSTEQIIAIGIYHLLPYKKIEEEGAGL